MRLREAWSEVSRTPVWGWWGMRWCWTPVCQPELLTGATEILLLHRHYQMMINKKLQNAPIKQAWWKCFDSRSNQVCIATLIVTSLFLDTRPHLLFGITIMLISQELHDHDIHSYIPYARVWSKGCNHHLRGTTWGIPHWMIEQH